MCRLRLRVGFWTHQPGTNLVARSYDTDLVVGSTARGAKEDFTWGET